MRTIWKYELKSGSQEIAMPKGAVVLALQTQKGNPCLWAEVDPKERLELRMFEMVETGHPIPTDMGVERRYVGTFQVKDGDFVFHVYEWGS